MSGRGWADIVSEAIRIQESGAAAVIATVVTNLSRLPAHPGTRLLIPERGYVSTEPFSSLGPILLADGREQLSAKRSLLRSYLVSSDAITRAGPQAGNVDIYYEVLCRPATLLIVGGGHIAAPLARVAKLLDFTVSVLDDRPQFANRARFPEADQIFVGPYRETLAKIPVDADTYVVLVTRGHVHDQACLEEIVGSPVAYIGMIGSQRRVRTVMAHAKEKGFDPALLQRVYAPIGLDIGADTPAEIAVAIMAEIVNVRRSGRAPSLALKERLRV
jgi:xanthine dehydrogenase accessory factor